jgi:hypothetical protein
MKPLSRIMFGTNPIEGVSYVSRAQATHFLEHFSKPENTIPVLEAAFALGVRTVACASNERVLNALEVLRPKHEFAVVPIIPNVYEYVRDSSDLGVLGAVRKKAERVDTYQKIKLGIRGLADLRGIISKDFVVLLRNMLALELAGFRKYTIEAVMLHGQITDLAITTGNKAVLELYRDLVKEELGPEMEVGLATHNFGTLLPRLDEWAVDIPIVMAPFNQRGFIMKPSRQENESLLERTTRRIVAKKVLAGGNVTPEEGFSYLKGKNVQSVCIGIASVSEAYHTLTVAKDFWGGG